jgi:hypothetical protein
MNRLFKNFDWKNGKFSEAQETYLKLFAQNQIESFLSGETDEEKAVAHLAKVYENLGKKMPKVVWHDSPEAMIKSVGDSVGASVGASVRASVWDSVWDSVGASVRDSVRDSVGASVWDSVWDSVGASVRDSVGASVGASVRASVWDSVGASVRTYDLAGWSSWARFFSEEFEHNALEDWCLYSEQVTGGILSDEVAHLVRKPKRLVRNANGLLHYDHDKAIEWNDGFGFYYLNGVEFDQITWETIVEEKLTLTSLGKIENADQRAVAVQMLRPDRLLKQVKAKLVNVGQKGTELYEVPNFMDTGETEYCMKMEHPSIAGKYYIEWVEPSIGKQKDADLCQAVAFGFTKEQYLEAEEA